MSGIHDVGGETGFGPVVIEPDEPVFHSDWERRVFAINVVAGGALGPIDYRRHAIERMSPEDYLRTSYYEKWLARVELLVAETGLVHGPKLRRAPTVAEIEAVVRNGRPATRSTGRLEPRFALGQRVRARDVEPEGHTRLPCYARGHIGRIHALRGTHVFPDTNAHGRGENPQPLYGVEFRATELWGAGTNAHDRVFVDLWEDYLEPPEEPRDG
jgi:nitrile hydratase